MKSNDGGPGGGMEYKSGDLSKLLSGGDCRSGDGDFGLKRSEDVGAGRKRSRNSQGKKQEKELSGETLSDGVNCDGTAADKQENASQLFVTSMNEPLRRYNDSKHEENGRNATGKVKSDVKENLERDERTLFVGNIPLSASQGNLKKLKDIVLRMFKQYGAVESVRLRSVPIVKVPIVSSGTYKTMLRASAIRASSGDLSSDTASKHLDGNCNAYVVYSSASSVANALTGYDNSDFHGNYLRLDTVSKKKSGSTSVQSGAAEDMFDRTRSVFVGNLPFNATEEQVRDFFTSRGTSVQGVRIIRDKVNREGKGFGYVLFESNAAAKDALRFNEQECGGRPIRVTRYTLNNPRQSNAKRVSSKAILSRIHQGATASFDDSKRLRRGRKKNAPTKMDKAKAIRKKKKKLGQKPKGGN